jgi:hypothetical protein
MRATCALLAGVAVRWQCGDRALLPRRPPVSQILPVHIPRGSWGGAVRQPGASRTRLDG